MDLLLTAGLPWPTILYTILIDEIMIITGLIGALVVSSYKVCNILVSDLTFANISSVGLLRLWLRSLLLGCLDCHLDCTQARSRHRRGCPPNLPHLRRLDHLLVVPVPYRLGTLRGWQRHFTRLGGRLLRYLGSSGQASVRCSPALGSPQH